MVESFIESLKSDPEMKAVNINTAFWLLFPIFTFAQRTATKSLIFLRKGIQFGGNWNW